MRAQERWALVGCFVMIAACGGGSAKKACPADAGVGATMACSCKGGASGTQTCEKNKTLSDCSCSGDGGVTKSGSSGSGNAGSKSTGTSGSSSAGSGGRGGSGAGGGGTTSSGKDAGTGASGASGAGGSAALPPPMDGNQLSLCTMSAGECNKDYACYSPGPPGKGYCSHVCTMDSDCTNLKPSGTAYTCQAMASFGGPRVCRILCMSAMDTTTCPTGMTCQGAGMTGGGMPGGGGGGGMTTFTCKYPSSAGVVSGTGKEWDKCTTAADCLMGLTCQGAVPATGGGMARPGKCSTGCTMTADCSNDPKTGTVSPACVPGAGPGSSDYCALPCAMAMTGCPDGMSCVAAGPASYCQFM